MSAVSQAQRAFLFAAKGPDWARAHHFDNPGPLPARAPKALAALRSRPRKQRTRT